MEELNTLIRIGEIMFRLVYGLTTTIIKLHHMAYHAQWYGRASFRKLHDLCGSNISYLEIATQDKDVLKNVYSKTFGKYKILYSPLPDLNTADGKSQVAFNSGQAEQLKSALNMYNAEKLEKLQQLKERYGAGTEAYMEAKARLDAEMPSIRSVSADDYVMTRLDEHGNETQEWKDLEASAKEEAMKAKEESAKAEGPEPEKETVRAERESVKAAEPKAEEEKMAEEAATATMAKETEKAADDNVIQFATAKKRLEYESLLKSGHAQKLKVADVTEEYVPISGKVQPFYHAKLDSDRSVILSSASMLDKETAVLENARKYHVIDKSGKLTKLPGKQISELLAKQAAKKSAKVAAKAAKNAVRAASKTNPYTAAAEAAAEIAAHSVKTVSGVATSGVKKR